MNVRKTLLMLLCMGIPVLAFSQSDTTRKKVPLFKKPANTTKLELTFAQREYYSQKYGTQIVYIPGVRINDARPVPVDRHGSILRRYYTKAPLASEQLDLMNQQRRRGNYQLVTGLVGGSFIFFSGVVAAAKTEKSAPMWIRMGIGGTMMFSGIGLKWCHSKRAEGHLRESFNIYNAQYYKAPAQDTSAKEGMAAKTARTGTPETAEEKHEYPQQDLYPEYRDTVYYVKLRNTPQNSGMVGIVLTPLTVDLNKTNLNFMAGIGAYYTYRSDVGISAQYNFAYVDNLSGENGATKPSDWQSYGIPLKYKKATRLDLQVKVPVLRFMREGAYHLTMGRNSMGTIETGRVQGKVMRALTARMGYIIDNRIQEYSVNGGIPYQTTTPGYQYPGAEYPEQFSNLPTSSAMLQSGIITLGVGWSTFWDMKIKLNDPDYHGRRRESAQSDLYFDILYAHQLSLQDMVYWHDVRDNWTQVHESIPQRINLDGTPLRKVGARIGAQVISCYRRNFGLKIGAEAGMNPGLRMPAINDQLYFRLTWGLVFGGRIASVK